MCCAVIESGVIIKQYDSFPEVQSGSKVVAEFHLLDAFSCGLLIIGGSGGVVEFGVGIWLFRKIVLKTKLTFF